MILSLVQLVVQDLQPQHHPSAVAGIEFTLCLDPDFATYYDMSLVQLVILDLQPWRHPPAGHPPAVAAGINFTLFLGSDLQLTIILLLVQLVIQQDLQDLQPWGLQSQHYPPPPAVAAGI
jgi:hypothetical protein